MSNDDPYETFATGSSAALKPRVPFTWASLGLIARPTRTGRPQDLHCMLDVFPKKWLSVDGQSISLRAVRNHETRNPQRTRQDSPFDPGILHVPNLPQRHYRGRSEERRVGNECRSR